MNDECIRGFFVFEHQQKRQTMIDLKPCPFCGGERDAKEAWSRRCE